MSVFSYFQYLVLAVSRLEDYGLANAAHKPPLSEKEHKRLQTGEIIVYPLPSIELIIDEILAWLTT